MTLLRPQMLMATFGYYLANIHSLQHYRYAHNVRETIVPPLAPYPLFPDVYLWAKSFFTHVADVYSNIIRPKLNEKSFLHYKLTDFYWSHNTLIKEIIRWISRYPDEETNTYEIAAIAQMIKADYHFRLQQNIADLMQKYMPSIFGMDFQPQQAPDWINPRVIYTWRHYLQLDPKFRSKITYPKTDHEPIYLMKLAAEFKTCTDVPNKCPLSTIYPADKLARITLEDDHHRLQHKMEEAMGQANCQTNSSPNPHLLISQFRSWMKSINELKDKPLKFSNEFETYCDYPMDEDEFINYFEYVLGQPQDDPLLAPPTIEYSKDQTSTEEFYSNEFHRCSTPLSVNVDVDEDSLDITTQMEEITNLMNSPSLLSTPPNITEPDSSIDEIQSSQPLLVRAERFYPGSENQPDVSNIPESDSDITFDSFTTVQEMNSSLDEAINQLDGNDELESSEPETEEQKLAKIDKIIAIANQKRMEKLKAKKDKKTEPEMNDLLEAGSHLMEMSPTQAEALEDGLIEDADLPRWQNRKYKTKAKKSRIFKRKNSTCYALCKCNKLPPQERHIHEPEEVYSSLEQEGITRIIIMKASKPTTPTPTEDQ
ncbi:hypothetical protein M569_16178 [Genlisea aurea]|uniref:Uncharacterized protein n=1 Tax=Genlisea aurea TaxID=192259 RepID=S8BVJ9_9LAMI|nr:hypothetical protein M569_16178 [Genlisea aurea]